MLQNDSGSKSPIIRAENAGCALCFCAIALLFTARLFISKVSLPISSFILIVALTVIAFAVPALVFSIIFPDRLKGEKISKKHRGNIKFCIACTLLLVFSAILTKSILFYISGPESSVKTTVSGMNYYQSVFVYALLPALTEEIFFRLIAFRMFEKKCGGLCAIFGSALFFALTHFSAESFVTYLVAGIILAVVMYITRSVIITAVMHFLNNLISFYLEKAVFKIASESNSAILAIFILAAISVILLMWVLSELESICRAKYLTENSEEQNDQTKPVLVFAHLIPEGEKIHHAFSYILFSPFTWTSIIVFIAISVLI